MIVISINTAACLIKIDTCADNYLYTVLIEDYNEYVPLFKKEID